MKRFLVLIYGAACYALGCTTLLYGVGFLGNLVVPKSLDSIPTIPMCWAILINGLLLGIFALQHSVMARPFFKRWLIRFIPEPMERSTYVLASSVALGLIFWQWQPFGGTVWEITNPIGVTVFQSLFVFGWVTILGTSFLINHFDLFGLRQVWLYFREKEYAPLSFRTPGPYRFVRHPLYVGWLIAFWMTPTMGISHFLFSIGMTLYILIAIPLEERDLTQVFGDVYVQYQKTTGMLVPRLGQGEDHYQHAMTREAEPRTLSIASVAFKVPGPACGDRAKVEQSG
ncbi:MAG: methanethiol S-methyltransferase [Gemmataceae bacterium]